MRRYWIAAQNFNNQTVNIGGEDFHHICEVCRQSEESRFEIINGDGNAYLVELTKVGKKEASAKIIETRKIAELKTPHINLYVSLPKFSTFEVIVEKAVELGAKELVPFVSDYSFLRDENSEKLGNKFGRWEKIVKSATQQSGRAHLMGLKPLTNLKKLLETFNRTPNAAGLFAYEGESSLSMKHATSEILKKKPGSIWVFIGSEGGFSAKEVEQFQSVGLQPSTLGDQVLRVETACLSMLSILRYEIEAL